MFRFDAHREDRAVLTTVLNFTGKTRNEVAPKEGGSVDRHIKGERSILICISYIYSIY